MDPRCKSNKTVLVTGGAGYIGSHMVKQLKESDYFPIVLDDLSSGSKESLPPDVAFYEGKAGDKELIRKIYSEHPFTSVIHFAASIQVGESVLDPLKYYKNNVITSINLFDVMHELGVNNIVFSSSAAVYGEPVADSKSINETHPKLPISPYGQTKLIVENILESCCKSNPRLNAVCLRYFNVAGSDPIIRAKHRLPPTNLIPIVLQKVIRDELVTIFGNDYKTPDGTCIRDYIHVKDLCSAHLKALEAIQQSRITGYCPLNLGTGNGHSVLEVIKAAETVIGKKILIKFEARRKGDPVVLVADGTCAQTTLKWIPLHSDLKTIVRDAWESLKLAKLKEEKSITKTKSSALIRYSFYATVAVAAVYVVQGISTKPRIGK